MNSKPRSIELLESVYGMRFLVRSSLDIPIKDGVAEEHFRLHRAIPTFLHLLEKGGRVIILTHVGRDPKNSTLPLLPLLEKYIPVKHYQGVVGEDVHGVIAHMKEGTALLLENLRSHEGEETNDPEFAKTLASYGDFYVNDAFAVSHRQHASIVGIPQYLPAFAGMTFMDEYEGLSKAFNPSHPSLFILGGAKFETKAPLIEEYAKTYTHTFIGGALANDFFKGKGYEVGTSLVSDADLSVSKLLSQENIILPEEVLAEKEGATREVSANEVSKDERIVDIGIPSVEALAHAIRDAKTILWNGPLGNYEGGYDAATKRCAKLISESNGFSVVGGGDTIAAIEALGLNDSFGFLSTSGGAMLEFLEKKTLPGIDAIPRIEP